MSTTPLPWKVWKVLGDSMVIRDEGQVIGETICECEDTSAFVQDEARNSANAALIVRAVNHHEALLSALRELTTAISGLDQGDIWDERGQIAWETARVAIANAEKAS